MFEMRQIPDGTSKLARGDLNGLGQGVTGVYSGGHKISLHKGSLVALQEHANGKYPGMKLALASSADTPVAEKVGRATLKLLEVQPGMTVWDLLMKDWKGRDINQIGRQPPLSSDKAATHFPILQQLTGISYSKMLFFDDCNWGDHCGKVARACKDNGKSVVTHRTPNGLREADWRKGLELYKQAWQE
jgi:magnesium-dependent phosphatase 1